MDYQNSYYKTRRLTPYQIRKCMWIRSGKKWHFFTIWELNCGSNNIHIMCFETKIIHFEETIQSIPYSVWFVYISREVFNEKTFIFIQFIINIRKIFVIINQFYTESFLFWENLKLIFIQNKPFLFRRKSYSLVHASANITKILFVLNSSWIMHTDKQLHLRNLKFTVFV